MIHLRDLLGEAGCWNLGLDLALLPVRWHICVDNFQSPSVQSLCQIERVGVKEHWIVECNSGVFSTLLDWSVNLPAVVVPLQGLAEEVGVK